MTFDIYKPCSAGLLLFVVATSCELIWINSAVSGGL
jgi:hypothetical protein